MTSHYGEGHEPQQRSGAWINQTFSKDRNDFMNPPPPACANARCTALNIRNTGPSLAGVETALICCVQRFIIIIICVVDTETLYRPTFSTLKITRIDKERNRIDDGSGYQ